MPISADDLLSVLRAARDVSAGSDELAAQVSSSWPLVRELSPQRIGLLAPLRLRPGLRAVDVGCGGGALTRTLADAGLDVLGIEPDAELALAAGERCRDTAARIVHADPLSALSEIGNQTFDLAVSCGALAAATDPAGLLRAVAGTLAADGVLVIAVENQLGLGYLTGGTDQQGKAFRGLADYPLDADAAAAGADAGPRAWTRSRLRRMFADAGLTEQRWLLTYPDHTLPKVILDPEVFARPDAMELVDKLVRDPLLGAFGGATSTVSARVLHGLAIEEGFAAAVAPAFLIVAARSAAAVGDAVGDGLGWLLSASRRQRWRRVRRLAGDYLETTEGAGARRDGWLRQLTPDKEPIVAGAPLDRQLLDALRQADTERLTAALRLWVASCLAERRELDPADERHPFLPGRQDVPVLPADCLDIHPGNVIVTASGAGHRVDREWHAGTAVDAELAVLRALHEFCREVFATAAAQPWGAGLTLRELVTRLCELAGLGTGLLARWPEMIAAEAELQHLVAGVRPARVAAELTADADRPLDRPLWTVEGGLPALRAALSERQLLAERLDAANAELHRATGELQRATGVADDLARQLDEQHLAQRLAAEAAAAAELERRALGQELRAARSEVHQLDGRVGRALAELADAVEDAESASKQADHWRQRATESEGAQARLAALRQSRLHRIGDRVLWPAGRTIRGSRDLLRGRGGAEPDGLVAGLARLSPWLGALAGARIRRRSRAARDAGLRYRVDAPDLPVPVGRGQVVELTGWLYHDDLPVRRAFVLADGHAHRISRGYQTFGPMQPTAAVPVERSGIRVGIPMPGLDDRSGGRELALRLRVELVDGTALERDLPAVELAGGADRPRAQVRWPGSGPRVAVCLTTYNPDLRQLQAQLDSVRAQTHRNWVCLVCDDASTLEHRRKLRNLIADDGRFVLFEQDANVGYYRNFERVLALVPDTADAVALCDQDDVWDADKLAALLAALESSGANLAYGDLRLIDDAGQLVAPSFWGRRRNQWQDLETLLLLNTVTGAASLMRAELLDRVLPFPPATAAAFHDHWMALTALASGTIAYVDRPVQSYRQHGGNVTGHQQRDLDDGLPSLRRLAAAAAGLAGLAEDKLSWLEWAAEHDLRRVAQFAQVLLLRNADTLRPDQHRRMAALATAADSMRPLIELARRGRRPESAGAERYLLAAALGHRAALGRQHRH